MKTTIEVNNLLVTDALNVTGLTAQQGVVELALKLLIQMKHQGAIRAMRGQLPWEDDLNETRTDIAR